MPARVGRCHSSLARPPLYKVKHGKDERYLKDDHELNQYMLRHALDGAALLPAAGADAMRGEALGELARRYLLAEAVIDRLARPIAAHAPPAVLDGCPIVLAHTPDALAAAARRRLASLFYPPP